MAAAKSRCSYGCVAIACLLVLVSSILLYVYLNDIFLIVIKNNVYLKPGGAVEKEWVNPTIPVYCYFYFYDLTNPDEVKQGQKPSFNEIGPFAYQEYRDKFDLKYLDEETVVQYRMNHYFVLDLEKSVYDPRNYTVTTLNTPLAVVLSIEADLTTEKQRDIVNAVVKAFGEHDLFIQKTVDELLWGYEEPIFEVIHRVDSNMPTTFGFQQKNITDDAELWSRVFTGKGDTDLLGHYLQWRQMDQLPYWGTPQARAINGSDGYLLPPDIQHNSKLYIFIDMIYRSGYVIFNGTGQVRDIPSSRFVIPKSELYNETDNKDNAGFFMDGPAGIINMSSISPLNPPLFMSKPHFLDAPDSILNSVIGLKQNRVLDDTFADIHALTGTVLRAHRRLQVNVLIKPHPSRIYDTSFLPEIYFPIFCIDETGEITPEVADEFKNKVLLPMNGVSIALIALFILTGCGFVVCALVTANRHMKSKVGGSRRRHWRMSSRPDYADLSESSSLLQ